MTEPSITLQLNITINPDTDLRLLHALDTLVSELTSKSLINIDDGRKVVESTFTLADFTRYIFAIYPDRSESSLRGVASRAFSVLLERVSDSKLRVYHLKCDVIRTECVCEGVRRTDPDPYKGSPSKYWYIGTLSMWGVATESFLKLTPTELAHLHVNSRTRISAVQEYLRDTQS